MTDNGYIALRDAVNLARELRIESVAALRNSLRMRGHDDGAINEAIKCWRAQS